MKYKTKDNNSLPQCQQAACSSPARVLSHLRESGVTPQLCPKQVDLMSSEMIQSKGDSRGFLTEHWIINHQVCKIISTANCWEQTVKAANRGFGSNSNLLGRCWVICRTWIKKVNVTAGCIQLGKKSKKWSVLSWLYLFVVHYCIYIPSYEECTTISQAGPSGEVLIGASNTTQM